MSIAKLVAGLREANVEMTKLAKANAALVETLSPTGGGGGGGGAVGPPAPPVVNFNSTFVTQVDLNSRPTVRTGDGSNNDPREKELIRAFGFFGMSFADKSKQFQDQILSLFAQMTKKIDKLGGGVELRMGGN